MTCNHSFEAIFNFSKNECLRSAHVSMTPCVTLQHLLDETKWELHDELIVVNIRYLKDAPPEYGYYITQAYSLQNGNMRPHKDPHHDLTPFYERSHMQHVIDDAIRRKGYTCKFYCILTKSCVSKGTRMMNMNIFYYVK